MIHYNFNTKDNILNIDYSGKIIIKDIIELYEKLLSEKSYPNNLLIFQDETNAEFIESENLIPVALDSLKQLALKYDSVKVAIWQTEPVKTAYSYFFKNKINILNLNLEIFYTKEAAINWLKNLEL